MGQNEERLEVGRDFKSIENDLDLAMKAAIF